MLSINQSTIDQTESTDDPLSDGNLKRSGTPVSARFTCDFHRGNVKQVCNSIHDITGYQAEYFTTGGINAFMDIIPIEDQLALLRLYLELSELFSRQSHVPKRSELMNLRHHNGHWITVELKILDLEFRTDGALNGVSGIVQLRHDPRIQKLNHMEANCPPAGEQVNGYHSEQALYQEDISKREKEVLYLIAHGYSSKMIADKLCISIHTATTHRTNLLDKFQAKNTAELVLMASRRFWL